MERWKAYGRLPETWVLAVVLGGRPVLAAALGVGRDEAAYWYWAWCGLDASYSLVTGSVVRVSTALLGDAPFALRLPGLLAGWGAAVLLVAACRALGTGRRTALLAGLALAASPWHGYVGTIVHPDAFLLLSALLFVAAAAGMSRRPGRGAIALAGAAALATFSKLTGALLLPPAAILLVRSRERAPGAARLGLAVVAAAGAGLALSLDPRVLEGVQDFGRFAPHLSGAERISLLAAEVALGGGPALVALALAGAVALRRAEARAAWPGWGAGALLLAFFAAFAVGGLGKGNWFLPGLAVLVPLGAKVADRKEALGWMRGLAAVSALLSLGAGILGWLPAHPALWEALKEARWAQRAGATYAAHVGEREQAVSPTRTWGDRLEEFRPDEGFDERILRAREEGIHTIASNDYGLAFGIAHRLGRDIRVLLPWDPVFARFCDREMPPREDVLFVSRNWRQVPPEWAARFREVRELPPPAEPGSPRPSRPVRVWLCRHGLGKMTNHPPDSP